VTYSLGPGVDRLWEGLASSGIKSEVEIPAAFGHAFERRVRGALVKEVESCATVSHAAAPIGLSRQDIRYADPGGFDAVQNNRHVFHWLVNPHDAIAVSSRR
jgi:hypothetical protein